MSQHRKKVTIRVSSQTAYHLCELAAANHTTEGKIVDRLVKASRGVHKFVETVENNRKANK